MKVLFLDFDGVLNSERYLKRTGAFGVALDSERMVLLKEIVSATKAKIVLTTSWRRYWESGEREKLNAVGREIDRIFAEYELTIFDKTPEIGREREWEIEAWLEAHPETENFAVLDDRYIDSKIIRGHFVKTDNYKNGLSAANVREIIEILGRRGERKELGEKKKIFVVSDIHGHFTELSAALSKAGFEKENENHLLVCCGDYFDRGNENVEVLKFFERLRHKVLLRGNHEDMLLKLFYDGYFLDHHQINGTGATLDNFFGKYSIDPLDGRIDFSGKTGTVNRLCDFIEETVNYFETENYVFVHGWLAEGAVTRENREKASDALWEKARWTRWPDRYKGERPLYDKTLVCGHVPTFSATRFDSSRDKKDVSIFYGNGLIAIDAATADTKRINVLVLEDNLL